MGVACDIEWGEEEFISLYGIGGKVRTLGKSRCRWVYNIKRNLRLDGVVCTGLI
jgi:hypothetical protein